MSKIRDKLYKFPTGLLWRINGFFSLRSRRKKFSHFMSEFMPDEQSRILDVGAYGGKEFEDYAPVNYLERWYPHKQNITVLGIEDLSNLHEAYPQLEIIYYDGKIFPFSENAYDFSFSNAVIEHVGSRADQQLFLDEMIRTSEAGTFITTPNRWFPIEAHTLLPFLHWLPTGLFRAILRLLGLKYWASEENLNLLSPISVKKLLKKHSDKHVIIHWRPWQPGIVIVVKKQS